MKILAVRFSNINSLKGRFEIDFAGPALARDGIFAITGPTGSGKTTILDAITLALFGKTPRLSRIGGGENELMTRGTSSSRSEVDFLVVKGQRSLEFRVFWEQRRARKSSQGSLQGARMSLIQLSPKQPTDDWESEKLSEVPRKVEDLTGLDFERFTRTCLLAQGQFAAFLEAKTTERAAVLEQITGTAIYSAISQAAFQRNRLEGQKIDILRNQLQGVNIISEEEFEALGRRVSGLQDERTVLEKQKQAVQAQISWVSQLNVCLQARLSLQEVRRKLALEREEHSADLHRLAEGRRAEPLRLPLSRRDSLRDNRRRRSEELAETRNRIPEAQSSLTNARTLLEGCRAKTAEFQTTAVEERDLIKRTRNLDQQMAALASQTSTLKVKKDRLIQQTEASGQQVSQTEKNINDLNVQRREIEKIQKENSSDQFLGSDIKALEEMVSQRGAIAESLESASKEALAIQNSLETDLAAVRKIEEKIAKEAEKQDSLESGVKQAFAELESAFKDVSLDDLQKAIKTAQDRNAKAIELQELGSEIRSRISDQAAIENSKKTLELKLEASGKALEELEEAKSRAAQEVDKLNDHHAGCVAFASLEDRRRELKEGEPCPLCGSTSHPFVNGELEKPSNLKEIEKILKKAKVALSQAEKDLKEAEKARKTLREESAACDGSLKSHGKTELAQQKKWYKLVKALDFELESEQGHDHEFEHDHEYEHEHDHEAKAEPETQTKPELHPEDEREIASLAVKVSLELTHAEDHFKRFNSATEIFKRAEKAYGDSRNRFQKLETRLAETRGRHEKTTSQFDDVRKRLSTLKQQLDSNRENLAKRLIIYGNPETNDTLLPDLQARWNSYQGNQKKLDYFNTQEQAAQTSLATAKAQLDGFSKRMAELESELSSLGLRIAELAEIRRMLFGDKDPDAEEKRLDAAVSELQTSEKQTLDRFQNFHVGLEKLRSAEAQQAKDLAAMEQEIGAAEQSVAEALSKAGYADERGGLEALLFPEAMKNLSEIENDLVSRTTLINGQLVQLNSQLDEHEKARPTSKSLDDLKAEDTAIAERHALKQTEWQESWKAFSTQKEQRDNFKDLSEKIGAAEKDREPWAKLDYLIGSAEGAKFQKFAQGLTFANIVYQANLQLKNLHDRYLLANNGLELLIVDRYMANTQASVKNLSGGEKFLASLALALGLAQMVGQRHRMDTLFIDEGFGALDPLALDTAVAALCGLQQQGKLIGVISHVEAIRDRIPVQLEVARIGGGFSTIRGPGCISP